MNNQEAFTQAIQGLISQGRPSTRINICAYRGPDNRKCTIGHLIPDNLYSESYEYREIGPLLDVDDSLKTLFKGVSYRLLIKLQALHDNLPDMHFRHYSVRERNMFNNKVKNLAEFFDLSTEGCLL